MVYADEGEPSTCKEHTGGGLSGGRRAMGQ